MNAPIYPKFLVGTTVYSVDIVDGVYDDETDKYEPDTTTVTAGEVIGLSLDSDGDFFLLVVQGGGTLSSWAAHACTTIEPEAST